MNEIARVSTQLPETIEVLTQFVLVGKAKLQTVNKLSVQYIEAFLGFFGITKLVMPLRNSTNMKARYKPYAEDKTDHKTRPTRHGGAGRSWWDYGSYAHNAERARETNGHKSGHTKL